MKRSKRPRIVNIVLKAKKKVGGLALLKLKFYYNITGISSTLIKTM